MFVPDCFVGLAPRILKGFQGLVAVYIHVILLTLNAIRVNMGNNFPACFSKTKQSFAAKPEAAHPTVGNGALHKASRV